MATFVLAVDVGLLGSGVAGAVPAGITDPGVALVRVRPDPGHYPAPGDDELWAGVPDVETDTSGKAALTLRVMTGGAYAVSVILAGRRIQATVPAAQTAGATVRLEDCVGLPTPGVLTDADVLRQRLASHVTTFTATTLPAGSAATVSQVDSADGLSHAVTLGVPQGVQGVQGERGFQGVQGETGPANALTIGTVTRVAPGGTPTATITGTAPSQTLNLGLVDGQPSTMLLSGTGSPLGVVTANSGVLYVDTAATMGAAAWRKHGASGAASGWVVVSGDTGRRIVAQWNAAGTVTVGSLPAGWVPRTGFAGFVAARRIEDRVTIAVSQIQVGVASTADRIWTPTQGFGLNDSAGVSTDYVAPVVLSSAMVPFFSSGPQRAGGTTLPLGAYIIGAEFTFTSTAAWPTTLPGIAG